MSSFAVSIAGHVDTADQEAQLLEQLRTAVGELIGVDAAFAHTQQYGQVNLLTGESSPLIPDGITTAADVEAAGGPTGPDGDTPDDATG
jgi:hypothetical protein